MSGANPYVGPRPFRRGEKFFGREREAQSLVNSVLASRVVLVHSPSGAGKTSLIQTSIVPAFEKRGFVVCSAADDGFAALRVNLPPPESLPITNRYVFSAVNGLIGRFTDRDRACRMTLPEAFEVLDGGPRQRRLVVFDQLEELLTLEPGDLEGQNEFFRQLGDVLDDTSRWGLLAMREDYLGALDRFREHMPGQLRSTFRLDILTEEAALRAVVEPAEASGVTVDPTAARLLIKDLARVHSRHAADGMPSVRYAHIEPALLQVVCYSLFRRVAKAWSTDPSRKNTITVGDVEAFRPFDKVIAKYYHGVVRDAAGKDLAVERGLRDWVEHHLISKGRHRRQTRETPALPGGADPQPQLTAMQDRYLIRDDPRPGGALWELSHDLLVGPILEDNAAWRQGNLLRWQSMAEAWFAADRAPQYLLKEGDYLEAPPPGKRRADLTEMEQAYLTASDDALAAAGQLTALERRLVKLGARLGFFRWLLALSLLGNLTLVVLLVLALEGS